MIIMFFLFSSTPTKTNSGVYSYIQNTFTSLVNYVAPRAPEKSTDYNVDTTIRSQYNLRERKPVDYRA